MKLNLSNGRRARALTREGSNSLVIGNNFLAGEEVRDNPVKAF